MRNDRSNVFFRSIRIDLEVDPDAVESVVVYVIADEVPVATDVVQTNTAENGVADDVVDGAADTNLDEK